MDRHTVVDIPFKEPVYARTIRINPTLWSQHISTKFEVYFIEKL